MLVLGIALAGAVGAPARYLVDGVVLDRTECGLPAGTFVVNVSGSFLLGVLTGLALYHAFPSTPKTILGTGFCGAYTTFSTFSSLTPSALACAMIVGAKRWPLVSLMSLASSASS